MGGKMKKLKKAFLAGLLITAFACPLFAAYNTSQKSQSYNSSQYLGQD